MNAALWTFADCLVHRLPRLWKALIIIHIACPMINATNWASIPAGRSTPPLGSFESARFRGNPLMRLGTKPGSPRRLPRSNVSTK